MLESQAALALGAELSVHPIGLARDVNLPEMARRAANSGGLLEPPRAPKAPRTKGEEFCTVNHANLHE
jgi:hypothetical protein